LLLVLGLKVFFFSILCTCNLMPDGKAHHSHSCSAETVLKLHGKKEEEL